MRDDLAQYRQSALVRQDIPVRGFVYDVKTGKLTEVFEQHAKETAAAPTPVAAEN